MGAWFEAVFLPALGWWIVLELFGLAALPIVSRLFPRFPDRGLAFAKLVGLILVGYVYWIGPSLHLVPANRGTAVLLLIGLMVIGLLIAGGRPATSANLVPAAHRPADQPAQPSPSPEPGPPADARLPLVTPWRDRVGVGASGGPSPVRLWLAGEVLFTAAFFLWATVRAFNPEIVGTEKPMELTFLNAVLRTEQFPPHDPWLAGHSVSYYYFGYVLVGIVAKLAGVPGALAFNLAVAATFALAAQAAFGLGTALVGLSGRAAASMRPYLAIGLLAAFCLVLLSNLVGFLDLLYSRNIGSAQFWSALAIDGFRQPYQAASWAPTEFWWWWKSSRVINTFVGSQGLDFTITEFPMFSFVLADLHPHVLALPFDMLVLAFALSAATSSEPWGTTWLRHHPWHATIIAISLGALGFLNSWDLPAYGFVFMTAVVVCQLPPKHSWGATIRDIGVFALVIGITAIVLYLPFYSSFQSQASGFKPVLRYGTQPHHFLIFWGPLVTLALGFLWSVRRELEGWRSAVQPALLLGLAPIAAWLAVVVGAGIRSGAGFMVPEGLNGKLMISLPIAALVTAAAVVGLSARDRVSRFTALLIATAFLLVLGAEHFYIGDVFNSRMNTVFKLTYQAWGMLAIAGAFGWFRLWQLRRSVGGLVGLAGCSALLLAGAYYPLAATYSKAGEFRGVPTLDGLAFARQANPDDDAAIRWLVANTTGTPVVLEATGGQYSEFGRVATRTGLPTVLGWAGHELQWRGSDRDYRGRDSEIDRMYTGTQNEIAELLKKYSVRYVFVGSLERQKYGNLGPDRWNGLVDVVYQSPGASVYQVRVTE